jgi:hypothetical protein
MFEDVFILIESTDRISSSSSVAGAATDFQDVTSASQSRSTSRSAELTDRTAAPMEQLLAEQYRCTKDPYAAPFHDDKEQADPPKKKQNQQKKQGKELMSGSN